MHTYGDILISEILYHYHDIENYITIIDMSIILHITTSMLYKSRKGRGSGKKRKERKRRMGRKRHSI